MRGTKSSIKQKITQNCFTLLILSFYRSGGANINGIYYLFLEIRNYNIVLDYTSILAVFIL